MRLLIGVLLVIAVLAPLGYWAVHGVRRMTGAPSEGPSSAVRVLVEGLIVLAVIVLAVFALVLALGGGS